MSMELSPAAERAVAAAGGGPWQQLLAVSVVRALLADDEGRPAEIVRASGVEPADWLARLPDGETTCADAYAALARRAGEEITSEDLLAAVLQTAPDVRAALLGVGVAPEQLIGLIRGPEAGLAIPVEPLRLTTPTDSIDTARILDANANRAREALRVIEDYLRFARADAVLAAETKSARHALAAALALLPEGLLTSARDTLTDVGTTISTPAEGQRQSAAHVAFVNLKRLQESLRSLEEYGKCFDPLFGQALESVRYRSYTLEKAFARPERARARLHEARLYGLLSGVECVAGLEWTIKEAADGGMEMVQLREKSLDDRQLLERARAVRTWTRQANVLLIVNDRPDIARLVEADGVHLGQEDLPVHEARRILGSDALIGVSTHTIGQVRQAVVDGASYIGVGPTFASTTKSFDHLAGLAFVRAALAETSLPAFVIGGVNESTIDDAVRAGAMRVAVGAAIAKAEEPRRAAALLRAALPAAD